MTIDNPDEYTKSSAKSATGIDAEVMDTPRSIQVIPEKLIQEQQAQDLKQILENVSGVQTLSVAGDTLDSFLMRGFEVDDIYQDGFAMSGSGIRVQSANIESVEVLKGPAAILYGRSTPGGIININTKSPQRNPYNNITFNVDKFGQRRLQLDSTGPLNESGSVMYRIVGSIEETDTFRKTEDRNRISRDLIAPSLTWNIDEWNSVTAKFEWIDSSQIRDRGNVLFDDGSGNLKIADVPRSRRFGESSNLSDTIQRTARIDYSHIFKNDWELEADIAYQNTDSSVSNSNQVAGLGVILPGPILPLALVQSGGIPGNRTTHVQANGVLARSPNQFSNNIDNYYGALRLNGETEWAGLKQEFTTGIDYNRRRTVGDLNVSFVQVGPNLIPQFDIINIFNPIYNQTQLNPKTKVSDSQSTDTQWGLYAQSLVTFSDEWKALFGIRRDRFTRDSINTRYLRDIVPNAILRPDTPRESDLSHSAIYETSPNAGVVFQPNETLSFFGSYSESFQPNEQSISNAGQTINIEPSTGKQYEVGVKGAFLNKKLNFNLAYFDIKRKNVPAGSNAITGVTIVNGEEHSKGLEFDTNVNLVNNLNLIFNYAYTDAEVSKGGNKGNTVRGIPKNSASLWATYQFSGSLQGFKLGGGAVYRDKTYGDAGNSFKIDSYTLFNAYAAYSTALDAKRKLNLQVGVRNLTDKEYNIAGPNSLSIGVGAPRTAFASIGIDF